MAPRPAGTTPKEPASEAAVRYLGPRPRSVLEVRRHLAKKGYDERQVADALSHLRELGQLDDADFARYWLDQRARFRPKGPLALRAELRAKGLDPAVIDEALSTSDRDEAAAAQAALDARLGRWRGLTGDERRLKARAFLRQRGFTFEVIEEVLARL